MNNKNLLVIGLVLILGLSSCKNQERPIVEAGFIDLSEYDFVDDGNVNLDGKWEFYWNQALTYEDFSQNDTLEPDYIYVPQAWTVGKKASKKYPQFGYATYRCRIKLPDNSGDYKIKFHKIISAFDFYINDKLYMQSGQFGTSASTAKPAYVSTVRLHEQNFEHKSDTIELIINVSDYTMGAKYPGLKQSVTIGTSEAVYRSMVHTNLRNYSLIGMLVIIGFYHLVLFFFRRNELAPLLIAAITVIALMRNIFTSELLYFAEPYISTIVIAYIPVVLYPVSITALFYVLFPKEVHKTAVYIFSVIAAIFLGVILFLPPHYSAVTEQYMMIFTIVVTFYFLFWVLIKAIVRKRQGSIWSYLGLLFLFITNLHDFLMSSGTLQGFGFYTSDTGFVIYLVFQAFNIAERHAVMHRKILRLAERLDYQNKNLEQLVKKRTETVEQQKYVIEERNVELEQQKEEILTIAENIRTANEEITKQNEQLERSNREITDSIYYAGRIQNALLPNLSVLESFFDDYFVIYRPRDIVSGDFYFIRQFENRLIFITADSTGHGVPGAFMSLLGMSLLREIIKPDKSPEQILEEFRDGVKKSLHQTGKKREAKDGIDAAICVVDQQKQLIEYSGANVPLLIIRSHENDTEIINLKPVKNPIGIYRKEHSFERIQMEIKPEDRIYMFSDGFADQFGGDKGRKFLISRFRNLIHDINKLPFDKQKNELERVFDNWRGNLRQNDDVLVVGLKLKKYLPENI